MQTPTNEDKNLEAQSKKLFWVNSQHWSKDLEVVTGRNTVFIYARDRKIIGSATFNKMDGQLFVSKLHVSGHCVEIGRVLTNAFWSVANRHHTGSICLISQIDQKMQELLVSCEFTLLAYCVEDPNAQTSTKIGYWRLRDRKRVATDLLC